MEKTVFISSCSRRELARRRPARSVVRRQVVLLLGLLAVALAVAIVLSGWL